MAEHSAIEWTDATWPIVQGCDYESPGCVHCYVPPLLWRHSHHPNPKISEPLADVVELRKGKPVFTGKVALREDRMTWPMHWKTPRRIFVPSHGDLFHPAVPDEFIDRVFAVMALCPQHTFQVLTKRAARMRAYMSAERRDARARIAQRFVDDGVLTAQQYADRSQRYEDHADGVGRSWRSALSEWPLPNVWLGVSTEDQRRVDERIPDLLATPAAVRFVSAEPLLGPINFRNMRCDESYSPDSDPHNDLDALTGHVTNLAVPYFERRAKIDLVIVGGESGPKARPMSIQWAREIRDQCAAANVPFFFKQWGEWRPAGLKRSGDPGRYAFGDYEHDRMAMVQVDGYPRQFTKFGARSTLERVGKKAAGRLLDGVEHNGMPGDGR